MTLSRLNKDPSQLAGGVCWSSSTGTQASARGACREFNGCFLCKLDKTSLIIKASNSKTPALPASHVALFANVDRDARQVRVATKAHDDQHAPSRLQNHCGVWRPGDLLNRQLGFGGRNENSTCTFSNIPVPQLAVKVDIAATTIRALRPNQSILGQELPPRLHPSSIWLTIWPELAECRSGRPISSIWRDLILPAAESFTCC